MAKKKGRPSEFKEKGYRLVDAFEQGCMSISVARAKAGVSISQWKNWARKGRAGEEGYENWWADLEEARGKILIQAEDTIQEAVKRGSTADAWKVLRVHGPDVYRDEKEPEEDKSRVVAYVPGTPDAQVELLQAQLQRVLQAAEELPEEHREKIIAAIAG